LPATPYLLSNDHPQKHSRDSPTIKNSLHHKRKKNAALIFQSIFKIQGTTGKIIESVISQRKNYKINLPKQISRPEVKRNIVEDYENHNLVMQLIHDQPVA